MSFLVSIDDRRLARRGCRSSPLSLSLPTKRRRSVEVRGYQPVSRIGEVVVNSFVDSYEFASLPNTITRTELTGRDGDALGGQRGADEVEFKPHWHEWATGVDEML